MKKFALTLHLWTGLVFGTILVVLGLTGSALSWMHELDVFLNPGLLHVESGRRTGEPLRADPALIQAVSDALGRDPRYGKPNMLETPARSGDVFVAWYRPAPGRGSAPWAQSVTRQVMVDPAQLRVTGERNWGASGISRPLLMPTLFHIHRYLVAGDTGKVVVAITGVSLLITVLTGMAIDPGPGMSDYEKRAFNELVERYQNRLLNFIYRTTPHFENTCMRYPVTRWLGGTLPVQ